MVSNLLVVVGYVSFFICSFYTEPDHWLVYVSISIASFGFYGLMVMGYVMVNQNCGHKARGSVMGINCLFGAVAILIIAQGGGYSFDKWNKSSPFLFAAAGSLTLFFVVFFMRNKIDESNNRSVTGNGHSYEPSTQQVVEDIPRENPRPSVCPIQHIPVAMSKDKGLNDNSQENSY